jgi:hypothetical protein
LKLAYNSCGSTHTLQRSQQAGMEGSDEDRQFSSREFNEGDIENESSDKNSGSEDD